MVLPLDFYLWGHVKLKVFESKPSNIQNLKQKVVEVIMSISPDVLQRIIKNFEDRLSICNAAAGDTLEI